MYAKWLFSFSKDLFYYLYVIHNFTRSINRYKKDVSEYPAFSRIPLTLMEYPSKKMYIAFCFVTTRFLNVTTASLPYFLIFERKKEKKNTF